MSRAGGEARRRRRARRGRRRDIVALDGKQLRALSRELERRAAVAVAPPRWNADPEEVRRSVAKLLLALVEFLRKLMERQAIRRMEAGTLTKKETEALGLALMRLEQTVRDLAARFGIPPAELNVDSARWAG